MMVMVIMALAVLVMVMCFVLAHLRGKGNGGVVNFGGFLRSCREEFVPP